jgi:hypothetical protein
VKQPVPIAGDMEGVFGVLIIGGLDLGKQFFTVFLPVFFYTMAMKDAAAEKPKVVGIL